MAVIPPAIHSKGLLAFSPNNILCHKWFPVQVTRCLFSRLNRGAILVLPAVRIVFEGLNDQVNTLITLPFTIASYFSTGWYSMKCSYRTCDGRSTFSAIWVKRFKDRLGIFIVWTLVTFYPSKFFKRYCHYSLLIIRVESLNALLLNLVYGFEYFQLT